jgi:hypothetical protein
MIRYLLTAVFSFLLSIAECGAARPNQAQLERDIIKATEAYRDDLHRFWLALDNDAKIQLQWHMVAYAAEFARNVKPDIIDAIIGDLRHNKTPYLGRARYTRGDIIAAYYRQQDYEGIIGGLDRRTAKGTLKKWLQSTNVSDREAARAFLERIRSFRIAKQPDGSICWQRRNFLQRCLF